MTFTCFFVFSNDRPIAATMMLWNKHGWHFIHSSTSLRSFSKKESAFSRNFECNSFETHCDFLDQFEETQTLLNVSFLPPQIPHDQMSIPGVILSLYSIRLRTQELVLMLHPYVRHYNVNSFSATPWADVCSLLRTQHYCWVLVLGTFVHGN